MESKYTLDKYYTEQYYSTQRMGWKETVYKSMGSVINNVIKPNSVIDFGCGSGVLSQGFDCNYIGIDGSEEAKIKSTERGIKFIQHDLREDISMQKADLVISIEVAEHLEEIYAKTFVKSLVNSGRIIIITASNEPGYSHFNCKPQSYWIDLFEEKKATYLADKTEEIKNKLMEVIPKKYDYLYNNLMVFKTI